MIYNFNNLYNQRVKRIISYIIVTTLALHFSVNAQCLKIESILVDACNGSASANPEDFNEMVRFRTGSTPLPISQISIAGAGSTGVFQLNKWPNTTKSWHGLVMNANTAALVAALNSSIQACGYIKEPPGGIIPPNSEVILVTSQYMNPSLNSFANLNDTIYMVFQDTVNNKGQGHFANWSSTSSYRYLCLIDNSTGCKDTVRYNVSLLPLHNDGDAVEYGPVVPNYKLRDTNYVNRGCQAPFIPLTINIAGSNTLTLCNNSSASFTATTGSTGYSSVQWSCSNGTFTSPNSFTTNFIPNNNFVGNTYVYCSILKPCGTVYNSAKDSVLVKVIETPSANISISPSATICGTQPATLSVNITNISNIGTYTIQWLPGNSSTTNFTTNTAGVYTVNVSNMCGTGTYTANINITPSATLSISASSNSICAGSNAIIVASSNATNYVWSTGATNTSSIIVNTSGTYTVSVSNACNTASSSISITVIDIPTLSIIQTPSIVCNGQTFTLTAYFNSGNLVWNNSSTSTSISANTSGVYSATVSNACGIATQSINVQIQIVNPLSINVSKDTLCNQDTSLITVSGGSGSYLWNTGQTNNQIIINNQGWYVVQSNTSCGLLKDSIYIHSSNYSISATVSDTAVLSESNISFICFNCNPNNTLWYLSNNTTFTTTSFNYSFNEPNTYTVIITSQNNFGCRDMDTLYIKIYDNIIFEVPNVFTPNGDNVNDEYFVRTRLIKELEGIIYNRWGQVMFEFTNVQDKWNGQTKSGEKAPDGTYFYIFRAKDITDKLHEKKGSLQIFH